MVPEIRLAGSRFLENLAYLVPGYRGYKEPANRREEDSRLRARLLQRLALIGPGISECVCAGADSHGVLPATGGFEARAQRLDGIADAIRYAPYGFSGFFDAQDVREDTLERILEADLLLFQDLDRLESILDGSDLPLRSGPRRAAFLLQVDNAIDSLEHHLISRDKILGDV